MVSKHIELPLNEAKERLSTIFANIEADQEQWGQDQAIALKPVEAEMDKCMEDNCKSLHKAAQKHFRVVGAGISPW